MNTRSFQKPAKDESEKQRENRDALFALSYEAASLALENEDALATALATELIMRYSERAGQELKEGRDYLPLLTPSPQTPAIERIAMEIVLESLEEQLDAEYTD